MEYPNLYPNQEYGWTSIGLEVFRDRLRQTYNKSRCFISDVQLVFHDF